MAHASLSVVKGQQIIHRTSGVHAVVYQISDTRYTLLAFSGASPHDCHLHRFHLALAFAGLFEMFSLAHCSTEFLPELVYSALHISSGNARSAHF